MPSVLSILLTLLLIMAGCSSMQPLPDQADMDRPLSSESIIVIPEYPTPGKKYLVERDGKQEVWIVKDDKGTINFVDPSSQRVKLSIKLGPCFSFANLPRHDFAAVGKAAYHTAPEDCKAWDGRKWTQTYAVQIPTLLQPCHYGARRTVKVEGQPGQRLVTSDSSVEITGPGVRGGYVRRKYRIVYSEQLKFFKELSPGYIGKKTIVLRELKD